MADLKSQLEKAHADLVAAQKEIESLKVKLAEAEKRLDDAGGPIALAPPERWPTSLVLTKSAHAQLSPSDQTEFRNLGGTVTEDPAQG